mmetsp:Transcript_31780/g.60702  ORF Transcript_31780/g.60702 Transcript_31780/m.60702 type:complete len:220 (-) Transcript_31780:229-888(-)
MEDVSAVNLHVVDDELSPLERNGAQIGILTARLRVEGRLVQNQPHHAPVLGNLALLQEPTRSENRLDLRPDDLVPRVLPPVVRDLHSPVGQPRRLLGDQLQSLSRRQSLRRRSRIARTLLLALHLGPEAGGVDCHAGLLGHEFGEIDGKAQGVVEVERLVARDDLGVGGIVDFDLFVEVFDAAIEHGREGLLFLLDDFDDVGLVFDEFGVGFAKGLDNH